MGKNKLLDEVSERIGISGDRKQHVGLMIDVMDSLEGSGLVFKGGSSILLCHGGSRFSEDLDFDVDGKRNLTSRIASVGKAYAANGWSWEVKNPKNTPTTNRYVILAEKGETLLRLKLDISLRELDPSMKPVTINGIQTYSSSDIFKQKVNAIVGVDDQPGRTKVRDIYDVDFLLKQPSCDVSRVDLKRLREGLGSPDEVLDRYIVDWEEDEITSDFELDQVSVDIFKLIDSRLEIDKGSELDVTHAVTMVESSNLSIGAINVDFSKPEQDRDPEP